MSAAESQRTDLTLCRRYGIPPSDKLLRAIGNTLQHLYYTRPRPMKIIGEINGLLKDLQYMGLV